MSATNPKVTVLMPVYNGERYLKEAIDSILSQTFTDFEFLIINDGSTDGSVAIIESYKDPRIRLVHNEQNLGLVPTLNKGIDIAKGEYIARMDSDDVSLPERLAKQVVFLDANTACSVVAARIVRIDEDSCDLGAWKGDLKVPDSAQICAFMPQICCIAHPTVIVRRSVFRDYRYDFSQKHVEDYDLWLRLCADGHKICKLDEPLLKYRVHSRQVTSVSLAASFGLANIQVKLRFLRGRIVRLRLNRYCAKVAIGLLRDVAILPLKLLIWWLSKFKDVLRARFTNN